MLPAPRQPRASTSKAAPKPVSGGRKRKEVDEADEVLDSLGLGTQALSFDDEDEEEELVEMEDDEEDEGEAFPEIVFGEEDSDVDYSGSSDSESLDSVDEEEEAALLAEIEAEDALDYSSSEESLDPLSALIRDNTTKPNELDTPGTSYEDPTLLRDYMKRSRNVISEITGEEKTIWDEEIDPGYGSDSSTEEVRLLTPSWGRTDAAQTTNRIGNVPAYFYDDLPHIGYDIDGKKILRPATGDELDKFLEGVEGEDGGWCVLPTLYQRLTAVQDVGEGQATRHQRCAHGGRARSDPPPCQVGEP